MSEDTAKTFLCDAMLGRLALWLRILGYDTIYADSRRDDADVIKQAMAEHRMLLTRDVLMLERRALKQYGQYLFIRDDDFRVQLKQVVDALSLGPELVGTRCNRCNVLLQKVEAAAVMGIVPPYVAATQRDFKRCPFCGRIYWLATHSENMRNEIEKLFAGKK